MICQNEIQTLPLPNSENKPENEPVVSTTVTKNDSEKKALTDTTNPRKRVAGIYKIVNRVNGKYYVGSSVKMYGSIKGTRWKRHVWSLNKNIHHNRHLQRAWNKYGAHNFDFVMVEELTDVTTEDLLKIEQQYLDIAKTEQSKCYNLNFEARGGDWSECSKIAFSKQRMGRGNPMYGKKQSGHSKTQISKSMKGRNGGMNNPVSDKTVYVFVNQITNESFTGTQCEFYKSKNYHQSSVSELIRRRVKSFKNWILIDVSQNF